jgi:lysophospholipid acyltransferase (LPLAT)-like uncharacterized protein
MTRIYRKAFDAPGVHRLLYHVVRFYSRTFRIRIVNEEPWLAHVRTGGRVLLLAWHQQFFSLLGTFKRYASHRPALMISRSRDGELIAGVTRRIGWHTVRGSSSSGAKAALREMVRHLRRRRLAGHVVDGPRGPMGRVKPGAIYLALAAGAAIVPISVAADRAWFFNSWDRFFVPKPFARVTIRFGPVMPLTRPRNNEAFEVIRLQVERVMRKGLRYPPGEMPF